MILTRFSSKHIELLYQIEKNQKTTSREQLIYSPFAFYMNIGMLKRYGLVYENGVGQNGRKSWSLTDDGIKFLKYIRMAEAILRKGVIKCQ